MEIKTKFNVGDRVLEHSRRYKGEIVEINCFIKKEGVDIYYWVVLDNMCCILRGEKDLELANLADLEGGEYEEQEEGIRGGVV